MTSLMKCPICGSTRTSKIYVNDNSSLCRYGFMTRHTDALAVPRNLKLNIYECSKCDFAWNCDFNPSNVNYLNLPILEAALHSPAYLEFQREKATWLSNNINLLDKTLIEIGGGSGFFMSQIKAKNRIIYEPSNEFKNISTDIHSYNKYFDPNEDPVIADLIIMRQVLEHIVDPFDFLNKIIKMSNKDKIYIYLEVPSYDQSKNNYRFYDFYYEHCNYFSLNSLANMCLQLGAKLIHLEACFNNELNICLLSYDKHLKIDQSFIESKDKIRVKIQRMINEDKKIAIWGASGNGVALLNELNLNYKSIPYVIDDDKRKQGLYIPYTGQEIISSESLLLGDINCIFIASQLHTDTIVKKCRSKFKNNVEIYNLNGILL